MSGPDPIGCIGLGRIGLPLCRNLLAAGHAVVGHRRQSMAEFEAMGGVPAASAADVARRAGIVLTCVDGDAAMDAVVSGPGGLREGVRPGQVVVCLSSHPVAVKRSYAAILAQHGAVLLDGEVSGTPGMVASRKAAIYLAGPERAVQEVEPAMRGMADTVIFLGAFGGATLVKLVNNFLVALHVAGTAQAMALGQALGLDPALMIPAIVGGSGVSGQFAIRAPWMAERRFTPPQGTASTLLHYLRTVQAAVEPGTVSLELVDRVAELFHRAAQAEDARTEGSRDVAAMLELFERQAAPAATTPGEAS